MRRQKLIAPLLAFVILIGSLGMTGCGEGDVAKVKEKAERIVFYADAGLFALSELRDTGALTGLEEQDSLVKKTLTEARDAVIVFLTAGASVTKFDASSKADLAKLFAVVAKAIRELKPKLEALARLTIEYLNRRGVTNIKDPDRVIRRLNFAFSVLDTSARFIELRFAQ